MSQRQRRLRHRQVRVLRRALTLVNVSAIVSGNNIDGGKPMGLKIAQALILLAATLCGASAKAWEVHSETDDFDGTRRVIAFSPTTFGTPYRESNLVVRCTNGKTLDVVLLFDYLNTTDGVMMAKFNDEKPKRLWVSWRTGGKTLFVTGRTKYLAGKLLGARVFKVRFNYFAHGAVTIEYDMAGARPAIVNVLRACGVNAS